VCLEVSFWSFVVGEERTAAQNSGTEAKLFIIMFRHGVPRSVRTAVEIGAAKAVMDRWQDAACASPPCSPPPRDR
jgi:hypothetical protein